jgi:hypothetical protein
MMRTPLSVIAIGIAIPIFAAGAIDAQTPLATIGYSPDLTLVAAGVVVADEDMAMDDFNGNAVLLDLGSPPSGAELNACHVMDNGDILAVFAESVVVGGLAAEPRDVVRIDAALTVTMELAGAAVGIPADAGIDALTMDGSAYLLSFDTSVEIGGIAFDDEDLVRFDGGFTPYFDGSLAGVDPAVDLDAAHRLANGNLLLSFDTPCSVDRVELEDEDVIEYASTAKWWLAWDGSASDPAWLGANLDALIAQEVTFDLHVARTGDGEGMVTDDLGGIDCGPVCTGSYAAGVTVTLSAVADPGSVFGGWSSGGCTGTSTCQLTMDSGMNVSATFIGSVIFFDGFESGDTDEWSGAVGF